VTAHRSDEGDREPPSDRGRWLITGSTSISPPTPRTDGDVADATVGDRIGDVGVQHGLVEGVVAVAPGSRVADGFGPGAVVRALVFVLVMCVFVHAPGRRGRRSRVLASRVVR
jgi:hypothetical protein